MSPPVTVLQKTVMVSDCLTSVLCHPPLLQASVCMIKVEDAQALANSTKLSIRDQQITASVAKVLCGEKYMHVA